MGEKKEYSLSRQEFDAISAGDWDAYCSAASQRSDNARHRANKRETLNAAIFVITVAVFSIILFAYKYKDDVRRMNPAVHIGAATITHNPEVVR